MPLADIMRPTSLAGIVGQDHILGNNGLLTRIVRTGRIPNMLFYGPPGVGKTTVARIIAKESKREAIELNATTVSLADLKDVIERSNSPDNANGVLLCLDEIQYINKKQQQVLLDTMETGRVILIASTTENPYFCVYKALISRCTVFEFKPISAKALESIVFKGFSKMGEIVDKGFTVEPDVFDYICTCNGGDVRCCLNTVELACITCEDSLIALDLVKAIAQTSGMCCSDDDTHYDILSALHKSIRGSDVNAALHYAARLLVVGDLTALCRRLLCVASEDIGLAYPQAISITKSCVDSAFQLGLPEARLPLADAVILLATAPKSNSAKVAIDKALADVQSGKIGEIPRHLQNTHFDGADSRIYGQNYLYPHDYPNNYVRQQYLPDELLGVTYYTPGNNKFEQGASSYWDNIKNK